MILIMRRERVHLEKSGVDGRIILRCILGEQDVGHGLDWSGSAEGHVADTCKGSNEISVTTKCGNCLTSCKPDSFSRRTLLHGVST
jgi:hypothetical protein